MPEDDDDDYEVGYRKPPKGSQFQKGRSGNPTGRPKGSKNFQTQLMNELETQVVVKENGVPQTITKQSVIIRQLVNKAMSGELKSITTIFQYLPPEVQDTVTIASHISEEDLATMNNFVNCVEQMNASKKSN